MHIPFCFLKLWNKLRKQTVAKDGSVIFLSFQTNGLQQTVDKACDVCYSEPRHEKTNVLVFYLVQHKPGCAATEDG